MKTHELEILLGHINKISFLYMISDSHAFSYSLYSSKEYIAWHGIERVPLLKILALVGLSVIKIKSNSHYISNTYHFYILR